MKIALVTTEYVTELKGAGGLANYLYRLALALKEMGHEPYVFTYARADAQVEDAGIPVYRMKVKNYGVELLDYTTVKLWSKALHIIYPAWKMSRLLRRVARTEKFDIIQYAQLSALGLFPLKNIPAVVRISSHTGLWKKHGGYAENWRQIKQQEALEMKACQRADGVFGPSRFIAALFEKELQRRVKIIETPFFSQHVQIDPGLYQTHLAGKSYWLFFGTLSEHKGLKVIAAMLPDFLRKYPDFHFVLAGREVDIAPGLGAMDYLRQQVGNEVLLQRVLYLGQIKHEQLFPIIQGAFGVTLPSLADNFPNACLEAMAWGKVVIGTFGNGFDQLIEQGESGFLVEAGKASALLEAMETVMLLPNAQKKAMENAAQQRIELLRPAIKVKELINYYLEIIAKHQQ
ncbi:glycosyltransferase family 4 protein [Haliscomenobacter hydrossis]|uniref:Glycosyl transferase group 1 n=1 Tax=Haliscomenobacter hydrossis (strain ATCC 27775 / DSM 1100 / LMG 10767 / O) TaxID=760192 RepID=F4KX56_HALH1|nr:glycosyltransferase family 4 protein [Haliscomenobacter hydrossis]AEE48284.1 glycosyl transferase group 1 [Haliscomenobacter hydrossis DSM 1100]